MEAAILAKGLTKRYGDVSALTDLDLTVPRGTVLGLLGPNGAGKTTTVRLLSTLMRPDSGTARVAGADVLDRPGDVRRRISLTGQFAALDERLTGRENLTLFAKLCHLERRLIRGRVTELLDRLDLEKAADRLVRTYSGGMRRRLDVAASLVGHPDVLFLDEPTTGLDLTVRLELAAMIRDEVRNGMSVLLTTQYLDEADQMSDRVAVLDAGRLIAEGSPDELKRKVGNDHLEITVSRPDERPAVLAALAEAGFPATPGEGDDVSVSVSLGDGFGTVAAIATLLRSTDVAVAGFGTREPSLEDVFLTLTGHSGKNPRTEEEQR